MGNDVSSPIQLDITKSPYAVPDELNEEFQRIYNSIHSLRDAIGVYTGVATQDLTTYLGLPPAYKDSIQGQRGFVIVALASVDLPAGSMVNIFNAGGGVINIRLAQANSMSTRAMGYVDSFVPAGTKGIIFLWFGYLAITVGAASIYYLSPSTPGGITTTKPVTVGNIVQEVGVGLSGTDLAVKIATPIQL